MKRLLWVHQEEAKYNISGRSCSTCHYPLESPCNKCHIKSALEKRSKDQLMTLLLMHRRPGTLFNLLSRDLIGVIHFYAPVTTIPCLVSKLVCGHFTHACCVRDWCSSCNRFAIILNQMPTTNSFSMKRIKVYHSDKPFVPRSERVFPMLSIIEHCSNKSHLRWTKDVLRQMCQLNVKNFDEAAFLEALEDALKFGYISKENDEEDLYLS